MSTIQNKIERLINATNRNTKNKETERAGSETETKEVKRPVINISNRGNTE